MWGLQGHTEQDEEGWGLLWLARGLVELTGQQGQAADEIRDVGRRVGTLSC